MGQRQSAATRTFWATWSWAEATSSSPCPGRSKTTSWRHECHWSCSSLPSWMWCVSSHCWCNFKTQNHIQSNQQKTQIFHLLTVFRGRLTRPLFLMFGWWLLVSMQTRKYSIRPPQHLAVVNSAVSLQSWNNQHIQWQPDHFCGIKSVSLPTDVLWKPDLTIEEM